MSLPPEVLPLVRRTFGPGTEVVASNVVGNWAVARLQLDVDTIGEQAPDRPSSVIAKWLRATPEDSRTDPRQMVIEVIGLQFTEERAPGLAPRVLAADVDHRTGGVVLLEDLSPREPLDALIRRDGVEATASARRAFARAMGRLAASTAGHDHDLRARLGDGALSEPEAARLGILGPPWEKMRSVMERYGCRIPNAADQEAAMLRQLFAEPGPFLALSNGDMATNNFMINLNEDDDGRLIDFEAAHFDHALSHAANFFVPGPPWMVINDPIAEQLECNFRTALVAGIPEAADDEAYETGIAAGCVAMGFERCGNVTVMDGRPPGHASRAHRIATVESAAGAAEARGRWTALTDLLRDFARVLRQRWPDADQDLASLAPYTPRG